MDTNCTDARAWHCYECERWYSDADQLPARIVDGEAICESCFSHYPCEEEADNEF